TNDAKVGLVIGVGLVIAVAVVFFRKELLERGTSEDRAPASVGNPPAPPLAPNGQRRGVPVRPTSWPKQESARRHTVAEGETLYGLAERYYGDGERFIDLYQANRQVLKRPDRLEPGTVLEIPDLGEPEAP